VGPVCPVLSRGGGELSVADAASGLRSSQPSTVGRWSKVPALLSFFFLFAVLSCFATPAAHAVDIRGGSYDVGVYFGEVAADGTFTGLPVPADKYHLENGVYYLYVGYTYYFRVKVNVDSTHWAVTITPDPLAVTATLPKPWPEKPWPTTATALPPQHIHVRMVELDGAEAVVEFDVPINCMVLPPQGIDLRLVTHDPDYEAALLSLPSQFRDKDVRQATVMHNNEVKITASVPEGCAMSLGKKASPENPYTWWCDAEGGGGVYYFRTHHVPSVPVPLDTDSRTDIGGTKVNYSPVPPDTYDIVIHTKNPDKVIEVLGTLTVGPMVTGLTFIQAIDHLATGKTDQMTTFCPYSHEITDKHGHTGYGLDINYTLVDLAAPMELKISDLDGGDLNGIKILETTEKGVLEKIGAHKVKWEGFDITIPELADEIFRFPKQNTYGGDWIAPIHVVREARYLFEIKATLAKDPLQEQMFRIEFEVQYEVK
jgi:hypothetical protein